MRTLSLTGLFVLLSLGLSAQKGNASANFNKKVPGAYLAVSPNGAQLMQIFADGNLSFELSEEFTGNNNFHESFSNPIGQWAATGKYTLAVTSLDLVMDDAGKFIGVSVATNTVQFDKHYQVATVGCQGALYAPGTDPFAEGAQAVPNSAFSCDTMVFHKVQ